MRPADSGEYLGLAIAALVLIIVLLASFMCLQLFNLRRPARARAGPGPAHAGPRADRFLGTMYYTPSCSSEWSDTRRSECRGITSGAMPSIETTSMVGAGPCCGRLGVPP